MDNIQICRENGFASVRIELTIGNSLEVSSTHRIEVNSISIAHIPMLIYKYQSLPGISVNYVSITPNFHEI